MKALAKIEKVHEYLEEKDYYESRSVGTKARSSKTCVHCNKTIPKGTPHIMHHFYPEFEAYPTHKGCETEFMKSLLTDENRHYLEYQHLLKDK